MWIISFLPSFVTHFIVIAAIFGLVVTSVPIIWKLIPGASSYKLAVQLLSIAILGFGLYLEGGLANEAAWQEKVTALEIKLAAAKKESAKINTVIVKEYVDKIKVIKEKGDTITEFIDREITVYDKTCPIPTVVIKAHNAAAKNDPALLTPDTVVSTTEHNAAVIKMVPKK